MTSSRAFYFLQKLALTLCLLSISTPASASPELVLDISSGKVVHAREADKLWYPASLTKMMTTYLVLEAVRTGKTSLESTVTISEAAAKLPPSRFSGIAGTRLTVKEGLFLLSVKSANDVAYALGEHVGGSHSNFVAMMNRKAKLLGMSRTQFVNSSGLHSNNQVTTARDMARLGLALTRDYAEYAPLFRAREITVQGKTFTTHNALLENYPGADGLKTGFICNAGFNIVATAKRSGKQVLVVTLGNVTEKARTAKAASLLNMGFDKGWGFGAPSLESLDAQGASNRPLNMRQAVCRKDKLAPTQGPVPSLFAANAPESASIDSTPAQSVDTDFAPLPPRRPMLLR